ncbi:MAG: hypothetical protein RLZZ399_694 [Verrucomicrobiota bacterium]|jgi:hypothetical protein
MKLPLPSLFALVTFIGISTPAFAQSAAKGVELVRADFSSDTVDRAKFGITSWAIPETWELRDGALACIYDPKQHPGQAHGKSINPRFKAWNVRVSYRVKFEDEVARLGMLINSQFPAKTGIPVWHIGDVNARLPKTDTEAVLSISERDFTYDENDPRNKRKSFGPAEIFKPYLAYEVPGISCRSAAPLKKGEWHQFVVESIGTQWTLWVDGKEMLTQVMKHAECEKETINFIGSGPLLLDDIVVEELPK